MEFTHFNEGERTGSVGLSLGRRALGRMQADGHAGVVLELGLVRLQTVVAV